MLPPREMCLKCQGGSLKTCGLAWVRSDLPMCTCVVSAAAILYDVDVCTSAVTCTDIVSLTLSHTLTRFRPTYVNTVWQLLRCPIH